MHADTAPECVLDLQGSHQDLPKTGLWHGQYLAVSGSMHNQASGPAQQMAHVQVPLSYALPAAAMRALFWARVVLLPLVRCTGCLLLLPYFLENLYGQSLLEVLHAVRCARVGARRAGASRCASVVSVWLLGAQRQASPSGGGAVAG